MRRKTRTTNDGQMDRMGGVSTAHPPSVGRIHDVSAENHAVVDGVRWVLRRERAASSAVYRISKGENAMN